MITWSRPLLPGRAPPPLAWVTWGWGDKDPPRGGHKVHLRTLTTGADSRRGGGGRRCLGVYWGVMVISWDGR